MNVADSMKRLRNRTSGSPNGHDGGSGGGARLLAFAPGSGTAQALMVIAPIALAGTAVYLVQQRRTESAPARSAGGSAAKARPKRRRPRSLLRYYGLGLVISALERESTRKAVIAGLKLAQKRA
jgi:hypothetical protein